MIDVELDGRAYIEFMLVPVNDPDSSGVLQTMLNDPIALVLALDIIVKV